MKKSRHARFIFYIHMFIREPGPFSVILEGLIIFQNDFTVIHEGLENPLSGASKC